MFEEEIVRFETDRVRFETERVRLEELCELKSLFTEERQAALLFVGHILRFEYARANHAEKLLGTDRLDDFLRATKVAQVELYIIK